MQGMFKQRNKAIEQSVKVDLNQIFLEKYLKENNLELNTKDTDKIIELVVQLENLRTSLKEQEVYHLQTQWV